MIFVNRLNWIISMCGAHTLTHTPKQESIIIKSRLFGEDFGGFIQNGNEPWFSGLSIVHYVVWFLFMLNDALVKRVEEVTNRKWCMEWIPCGRYIRRNLAALIANSKSKNQQTFSTHRHTHWWNKLMVLLFLCPSHFFYIGSIKTTEHIT